MPNRSRVVEQRRLKLAKALAAKIKVKRLNNLTEQVEPPPALLPTSSVSPARERSDAEDHSDEGDRVQSRMNTRGDHGGGDDGGGHMTTGTKRAYIEDGALDNDAKQAILQIELNHPSELLTKKENTRANSIVASLTSRYYGMDGELQGPLGMFKGVKVFIVYPPKPEDYLESLSAIRQLKIKEEERDSMTTSAFGRPNKVAKQDHDHSATDSRVLPSNPVIFDVLSKVLDDWRVQREESLERMMDDEMENDDANSSSFQSLSEKYANSEIDRQEELNRTLKKMSDYTLCRNK